MGSMSQYAPQNPYIPTPMSPADEKLWATLTHVGGIFFSFVPALVAYIALRDRGPFVRHHAATALNFQLTVLIAQVIGGILVIVFVGTVVLLAVSVMVIVFGIIAAIAANRGEWYAYPLTIRFVR